MSRPAVIITCAARRCTVPVERGHLMCKGHWYSVPKPLRDDVWRTFRRMRNWLGRASSEALKPLIAEYREAVRTAVDHLDGVPPTPAAAMQTVAFDGAGQPIRYEQGRLL